MGSIAFVGVCHGMAIISGGREKQKPLAQVWPYPYQYYVQSECIGWTEREV